LLVCFSGDFFLRKWERNRYLSQVRGWLICILFWSVVLSSDAVSATIHTLVKGDTYYSLSRKYGVSVTELQKANPLVNPSALRVGQKINIPVREQTVSGPVEEKEASPGEEKKEETKVIHVVSRGETLTRIAAQHQVTVAELKAANGLQTSVLQLNQKLVIPTKKSVSVEPELVKKKDPVIEKEKVATPSPSPVPRYLFVSAVKREIDRVPQTSRKWKYVVIHHSGTSTGNAQIFEYYHRRVRGMENGMAYHFVIGNGADSQDGKIEVGLRWKKQLQGGHLRSEEQNEVAIGICLVGDFNRSRPTRRQIASLIELTTYLRQRQSPQDLRFVVHRDINVRPTDCPGKFFPTQAMYHLFGKKK
jgi:LysM repeat protein